MARLACCAFVLLLALINLSDSKPIKCGDRGMNFRKMGCRTTLGMFKRLLNNIQDENSNPVEDDRNIEESNAEEVADLRALLYGDESTDKQAEKRTGEKSSTDLKEKELQLRKYKLEMDLTEELLRDLEHFDLGE